VEDCVANLSPWVDDFAILDDTKHDRLWRNESEYRYLIRNLAIKKKADYLLITSPDERWEKNAGTIIRQAIEFEQHPKRPLTRKEFFLKYHTYYLPPAEFKYPGSEFFYNNPNIIYTFDLRELWTPRTYRIDGIWGKKKRPRLFAIKPGQVFDKSPIQCKSYPINAGYTFCHLPVNIYHLKMINPSNRKLRAEVFTKLDPNLKYQSIGYDYLFDETGLQLEQIPKGRGYSPRYKEYTFTVPKEYL